MGTVSCVYWMPTYMRQANTVVALMAGAMDSALTGNVDAPLFGPYMICDAGFKQVKTRYDVYVPPPLVGHLLGWELTAHQAWDWVRGAIVDLGNRGGMKNPRQLALRYPHTPSGWGAPRHQRLRRDSTRRR